MRLTHIRIRDFQGIQSAEIQPGPLTLFYGPNGAGKSSIADAIRHALTGEPTRGGTLSDVIRQGARSAEVEVHLDGGWAVTRRRSRSAGTAYIRGVEVKAGEAEADLERVAGASVSAISASLVAGRILDMKPAELQALLAGVTGAKLDAKAIAAALGTEVTAAAKRLGLTLPASLDGFADACKRAEGARQAAKRVAKEREADLARLPPAPHITATGDVQARLRDLRTRRDRAIAARGRTAGAREALEARLAELRAVPAPDPRHADTAKSLADCEAQIRAVEDQLLHPETPRFPDLEKAVADADAEMQRLAKEGAEAKALADRAAKAECGGACPVVPGVVCPLKRADIEGAAGALQQRRDELAAAWKAAREAHGKAREALEAARRKAEEDRAASLTQQLESLRAFRETAAAELARMGDPAAYQRAQQEIASIERQLAERVEAEPIEPLDEGIRECEAALSALAAAERRKATDAALREAQQQVADADLVAQACGPKGARARLLASAVAPFVDAANSALADLAPGYAVQVGDDLSITVQRGDAILRPEQLSDGERVRVLTVLQYAVARLAKVGVLILDRTELVDDRNALKRLAVRAAGEGMQVLMLTCAPAPETVPAGVVAYSVRDGQATRIPEAAAA